MVSELKRKLNSFLGPFEPCALLGGCLIMRPPTLPAEVDDAET